MNNINMTTLRPVLSRIFFGDAAEKNVKYIIPLTGNWLVPSARQGELVSTWIGYQISSIVPKTTSIVRWKYLLRDCEVTVRLWSIGEQAEEFITSVLWWDDRADVALILEEFLGKLIHSPRKISSTIYSQEGFNSELVWLTDVKIMCYLALDTKAEVVDEFSFSGEPTLRNLPDFKEE